MKTQNLLIQSNLPVRFLPRLKCRASANDSEARCTRATLWYFSHTNIYISCAITHHFDLTTVCSLLHIGSSLPPHEKIFINKIEHAVCSQVVQLFSVLKQPLARFCENSLKVQTHLFFLWKMFFECTHFFCVSPTC